VIDINGTLHPGRIHTLILTADPLNRDYIEKGGIYFDKNLKDKGMSIVDFLSDRGVRYASLQRDNTVEGRSWEMAAVLSMCNIKRIASGTVNFYDGKIIRFGAVPGLQIKAKLVENLITNNEIPMLSISQ